MPTERDHRAKGSMRTGTPGGWSSTKLRYGQDPVSEADGGAEPDAVVVLEVLVPLPHAQQLVPAHPEAEAAATPTTRAVAERRRARNPAGDAAPRAFHGPRTAVMGQDA